MTFETLLTCLAATQNAAKRKLVHRAAQNSLYRAASLEEALRGMAPWYEPVTLPEPEELEPEPQPEPEPVTLRPAMTVHKTNDQEQVLRFSPVCNRANGYRLAQFVTGRT